MMARCHDRKQPGGGAARRHPADRVTSLQEHCRSLTSRAKLFGGRGLTSTGPECICATFCGAYFGGWPGHETEQRMRAQTGVGRTHA